MSPNVRERVSAPIEREADFQRSQFVLAVSAGIPFAIALLLQLVSARTPLHWIATATLLFTGGASIWQRLRQEQLGHVCHRSQLVLGVWITLAALVVLTYVGPFTAGAIVLSPICYVFGFARPKQKGDVVLAVATVGFWLVALLALLGAFDPAHGPIGLNAKHPTIAVLGLTVVTEIVMVASFMVSRQSRDLLGLCFDRIEQANAALIQRDHELAQARWDLDHVIELAQVGHLTGTRMGDYRVGELIGRGGMGEVYRAWGADASHPIALKVLTPSMSNNPAMVERFFREARISSSLASPHIVGVLDSGWADGGYPFLAMELLRGRDLAVHLEEKCTMETASVVELVDQVAAALEVAHTVGIVHRDIKPENIFCSQTSEGPRWVVLDFGVSKVKGGTGTLTQGGLIGTPRYMAPEQARGVDVDGRADVFSLGAITYRCLTGRAAFDADDPLGALVQVLGEQPVRPRALADIGKDVELVLALALAKNLEQRFSSVSAFARALVDASRGELDDRLRCSARALLAVQPWNEEHTDAATIHPGDWLRESGDQRMPTSPLPFMTTCHDDMGSFPPPPPPPPFREAADSITVLAS